MSRTEAELWALLGRDDESRPATLAQLEDVVRQADADGLTELAFTARRRLVDGYVADRRWDKAFPVFARCRSEFGERSDHDWYVGIARSMTEFPDIPLAHLYGVFDDLERRFLAGGHDLRDLIGARRRVAQFASDWPEEQRCHRAWLAAGGPAPNSMRDFAAEVERLVWRGDETSLARARELAAPVLAGQVTFDEPPVPIQCLMLLPLVWAGAYQDAVLAHRRAVRATEHHDHGDEYTALRIEFCALTGNEDTGLRRLERSLPGFPALNPFVMLEFATSASVLLGRWTELGRGAEPVECGREPAVPAAALRDEMTRIALDLAERFDRRNGTTHQGDRIRRRLVARPLVDFLPLTPAGRKPARTVIPPGLAPVRLLDRAEWHERAGEPAAARDHLAAIPDPPPSHLAARVAELRAALDWNEGAKGLLRWAAESYRAAGDHRRYLLCQSRLGWWLATHGRVDEGVNLANWAVGVLRRLGDAWAIAFGELRLARALLAERRAGVYPAIQRAGQAAAGSGDPLAIGVIASIEAEWREADRADPAAVISLATAAKDALLAAGSFGRTIGAFTVLKRAYARSGDPAAFDALVRAQLAALPPHTPAPVVGQLRGERGRALLAEGRAEDAIPDLTEAVAEARSRNADTAPQWFHLAAACHVAGRLEDALDAAGECVAWPRNRFDDPTMADRARLILADTHHQLGEIDAAVDHYERLVTQAREAGNIALAALGGRELGKLLTKLNRDEEAAARFRATAESYTELGDLAGIAFCRSLEAMSLFWCERTEDAVAALDAAERAVRAVPAEPAAAHVMSWAQFDRAGARIMAGLGRCAEAISRAERGAEEFRQAGAPLTAVELDLFRAQLLLDADRPELAEPVLRAALDRCGASAPHRTAVTHELYGTLIRLGRTDDAETLRADHQLGSTASGSR